MFSHISWGAFKNMHISRLLSGILQCRRSGAGLVIYVFNKHRSICFLSSDDFSLQRDFADTELGSSCRLIDED